MALNKEEGRWVRYKMNNTDMETKTRERDRRKPHKEDKENYAVKLDGRKVILTHLNKLYWPDERISKGDLIYYYTSIYPYIIPYLKNRPQNLKRNPGGIEDEGFYHKDAGDEGPAWLKSVSIYSESTKRDVEYIVCNDQATLTYLNNLGCIEINPWHSTIRHLDKPNYLVIDIDPPDENSFDHVVDIALIIKELMDDMETACYCKTSGASGMHVYVPLGARYTYDEIRPFAQGIAEFASQKLPKVATTERPVKKRKGKIYVDYLQNSWGQTVVAPYSVRPVPGAKVSAPLQWPELKHGIRPGDFTIFNVAERLEKLGDLFDGVLKEKIDLEKCFVKLKENTTKK